MKEADRDVLRGIVEGFRHFRLMIQSSAIGTAIGMMPGLGAPVAHWISYAVARNTEKGAHQTFGKGDVRGVIASDAPNSSADGGELFPTLAFGIPGTAGMSIMIAIFVLCGFTPGYSMMTNHLDVVVALVYVLIIANTLTVPIVMVFAPYLARLTLANPAVLAPIVIWVAMLAAYMTTNSVADLAVVLDLCRVGSVHEGLWLAASADPDRRGARRNHGEISLDRREQLWLQHVRAAAVPGDPRGHGSGRARWRADAAAGGLDGEGSSAGSGCGGLAWGGGDCRRVAGR